MNAIQALIQFFNQKTNSVTNENVPDHLPNAWGRYEYNDQFFEAVNNHHFDANSNNHRLGWIQNYANNRLLKSQGRKQKSTLVYVNCKTSYRAIS